MRLVGDGKQVSVEGQEQMAKAEGGEVKEAKQAIWS